MFSNSVDMDKVRKTVAPPAPKVRSRTRIWRRACMSSRRGACLRVVFRSLSGSCRCCQDYAHRVHVPSRNVARYSNLNGFFFLFLFFSYSYITYLSRLTNFFSRTTSPLAVTTFSRSPPFHATPPSSLPLSLSRGRCARGCGRRTELRARLAAYVLRQAIIGGWRRRQRGS